MKRMPSCALLGMALAWLPLYADAPVATTQPVTTQAATTQAVNSKPVVKDGLELTVTLARQVYARQENPLPTVTFKNVARTAFTLDDLEWVWNWAMFFENTTTKQRWQMVCRLSDKEMDTAPTSVPVRLPPNGTLVVTVPNHPSIHFMLNGDETEKSVKHLPPGHYRLTVEIQQDAANKPDPSATPPWFGTLRSQPVELEIK